MNKRQARRRLRRWGLILASALLMFSVLLIFARFLLGERPDDVRPVAVLSGEWEPFVGEDLEGGGPVAQIMSDVLEGAGFESYLSFTTWDMVDQRTAGGSAFGGFPLVGSEDRRERMLLSEPLVSFDYVLYMRADATNLPEREADLAALSIAGVVGYDYWEALERAANLSTYPSTAEGFAALAAGEIDVFVEGTLSAEASLAHPVNHVDRSMFQVVAADEAWARSEQELFFMMPRSREAERVMERVNASLELVKLTPEYAERIASLNGGGQVDAVRLVRGSDPLVAVYDNAGRVVDRTPPGTRATVLDWGSSPEDGDQLEPGTLIRLKFTTGNLAGSIARVEAQYVEVQ